MDSDIEVTLELLSIFNYIEEIKRSNSYKKKKDVLEFCLCPCFKLGEMTTSIFREEKLDFFSSEQHKLHFLKNFCFCNNYNLGIQGYGTCILTGILNIFGGGPCSPFLGCYTCLQRLYIRTIYRDYINNYNDHVCPSSSSCYCFNKIFNTCCQSIFTSNTTESILSGLCCIYPLTIMQHYYYLNNKNKDGLLRYPWESQHLNMLLKPPCKIKTNLIYIIGPTMVGKSVLFQKLLLSPNGTEKESLRKIRVGVRSIALTDDSAIFLEVWDVPPSCLELLRPEKNFNNNNNTLLNTTASSSTTAANNLKKNNNNVKEKDLQYGLFIFNSTDPNTFKELCPMILDILPNLDGGILVGTHDDIEDGTEGFGSKAILFAEAHDFALEHNLQVMTVNSLDNIDVQRLYSSVRRLATETH